MKSPWSSCPDKEHPQLSLYYTASNANTLEYTGNVLFVKMCILHPFDAKLT